MDFKRKGPHFTIYGSWNEDYNFKGLNDEVRIAVKEFPGTELSFDLSNVDRANSVGMGFWIKIITDNKFDINYTKVPSWLASQFNLYSILTEGKVRIEKIQAPFFSHSMDEMIDLWLTLGDQIPLLDGYEDFEFSDVITNNGDLEPEFVPEEYFDFISYLSK